MNEPPGILRVRSSGTRFACYLDCEHPTVTSCKRRTLMKSIIAVLCCAVAVGCTEATKSNSTDVTAKKPVIEEGRGTTKDHGSVTGDNSRTTPLDQKEDR